MDYPSNLTQMEDGSYREVETLYYTGNYHYDDAYRVLDGDIDSFINAYLVWIATDEDRE